VTRDPGLNALPANAREDRINELRTLRPTDAAIEKSEEASRERLQHVFASAYELQGSGHLELAKLFVERMLNLVATNGVLAIVLPGNSCVINGWSELRAALQSDRENLIMQCRNSSGWLFPDVDGRQTVAFFVRKPSEEPRVAVWPAVVSEAAVTGATNAGTIALSAPELVRLSDRRVVPWFNSADDNVIFRRIRDRPTLSSGDGWIEGWSDSATWDFSGSGRHRTLASGKAGSDAWHVLMTRHVLQYGIATNVAFHRFVNSPAQLAALNRGVEIRNGVPRLNENHPLITYRYPARNDDSRTVIATALPEAGYLYSTGYAHGIQHPDGTALKQKLALLGFLNSYICDWWSRRFVDRHLTAPIINALPLPDWSDDAITEVATFAAALSVSRGVEVVAQGSLEEIAQGLTGDALDWRVEIERAVAAGYGLPAEDMHVVFADFNDTAAACPPEFRDAFLGV
jgi:hypothetical protein